MLGLSIIFFISSLIYFLLKLKYFYWEKNDINGPEPSLFVGNIGPVLRMSKHFGTLVEEWYKKFSNKPYFGYFKCLTPVIVLRDPDIIKDAICGDGTHFNQNDFGFNEKYDPLLVHNPFLVTGTKWKNSRGILSPIFTNSKMKIIFPLMENTCEKLKKFLKEKDESADIDSKILAANFTTDNVVNCAFSMNGESFTDANSEFRVMGKRIFQPSTLQAIKFMITIFFPSLLHVIPVPFLPKEVDVWFRKLLKANIKSRETQKFKQEDLLDMLLESSKKHNMDDTQITGHALSFFTEGYETSSSLLCHAMYQMAVEQNCQQQLFDEIAEEVLQHNGQITFDAIQKMSYLDNVMYETLRIHPIAMTLNKVCTKNFKLPPLPGKETGYEIKVGTSVVIPVHAIQTDPLYFPDPTRFDPNRHTEEERKMRHKAVFMPFGEGPRKCLGMRLALIQTKAALATIVKNYKINLSENCKPFEIDPKSFLYQSKHPILLNFEMRK